MVGFLIITINYVTVFVRLPGSVLASQHWLISLQRVTVDPYPFSDAGQLLLVIVVLAPLVLVVPLLVVLVLSDGGFPG